MKTPLTFKCGHPVQPPDDSIQEWDAISKKFFSNWYCQDCIHEISKNNYSDLMVGNNVKSRKE